MSALFISHSSRDNAVAEEVREHLQGLGHRSIFLDFDPADGIPAGRNWEQELYAQLRACQAIVVLCSEHSMASDWCFAEITHAKSMGKHVFPVKVAPCEIRSLLGEFQILDLTANRDDAFARLGRGLEIAGLDPKNMFDWDGSRPPYPGLLAFQESDAAIFFGRDAEIREGLGLMRRLEQFGGARWTVVLGASGSGKSSLVRAGILPRLARDHEAWLPTRPFRPMGRPFDELAEALAEAFERHGTDSDAVAIRRAIYPSTGLARAEALIEQAEALRRAAGRPRASVLLPLDQLEELLGGSSTEEAAKFLSFLRAALEKKDSPVRMLATLRSDFLGEFQGHSALRELAFASLTVGPMSADGFAQVIEGPAELAGIELGPGLVQAMVQDTETDDALPLLAFTLRELWESFGEDGRLEVDEYRDKLGGLSGAVALAAEAVIEAQPQSDAEQEDLRAAFVAMVRINEEGHFARQPVLFSDMPQSVRATLERFVTARLLVVQGDGRESRIEVAHEALLRSWDRLVAWLKEDRAFLLWRKRVEEARREWLRTDRDAGALLRGPALAEASGWSEKYRDLLTRDELTFIEASLSGEHRRRRRRVGLVVLAMLTLAVFAAISHLQRTATKRAMIMAHDSALLNHSRALRRDNPGLASQVLLDLHNPDLYLQSLDLDQLHQEQRLLGRSPDSLLVAVKAPGGVDIEFAADSRWTVHLPHSAPIYSVAIEGTQGDGLFDEVRSSRGRRVLTVAEENAEDVVRLWELPEVKTVIADLSHSRLPPIVSEQIVNAARLLTTFAGHDSRVTDMTISPDGSYAATVSGSQLALWRTDSGAEPIMLAARRAAVTTVTFGPESRRLLATSTDGDVLIFDVTDVFAPPRSFEGHQASILSGAFSHLGRDVLTLSEDGEIWWWKLETEKGTKIVAVTPCDGLAIGFADNANAALLACTDGTARVITLETGDAAGSVRELR